MRGVGLNHRCHQQSLHLHNVHNEARNIRIQINEHSCRDLVLHGFAENFAQNLGEKRFHRVHLGLVLSAHIARV